MASGKQAGDFSFKFSTFFNTPGPAGDVLRHVTWEGTATGFGALFVTTIYAGGSKGGTFSECGHAFLENGDFLNGVGQGTYESSGKNKWRTAGFMQLSDGRRVAAEGEIDLAQRSWAGKSFEMS